MRMVWILGFFAFVVSHSLPSMYAEEKKTNAPCQQKSPCQQKPPSQQKPRCASAQLNPAKGSRVYGYVTFKEVDGGTLIIADVENLEPGKHGFIIHEYGDCSACDGSSTGGHYNPTIARHGGPDHLCRHIGDLGNIVADEFGHGHYERIDKVVSLSNCYSIIGKSICVHANADDYTTQPTGNVGGRVAFGVIE